MVRNGIFWCEDPCIAVVIPMILNHSQGLLFHIFPLISGINQYGITWVSINEKQQGNWAILKWLELQFYHLSFKAIKIIVWLKVKGILFCHINKGKSAPTLPSSLFSFFLSFVSSSTISTLNFCYWNSLFFLLSFKFCSHSILKID